MIAHYVKWSLMMVALLGLTSAIAQRSSANVRPCAPAPAMDQDFPDPGIFADPAEAGSAGGRVVFAYGTNILGPDAQTLLNIPVSRSADPGLSHWTAPTDALPRLPAWAQPTVTWAPAAAHRAGQPYLLYFTARYGQSGRPCIGVAVSRTPDGPFAPTSQTQPLVCPLQAGGAIDPSVFSEDDGGEYLLWKTDANCCAGVPTLYIQKLSADGLSLIGTATPVLHRDQAWEGRVVEAPTLIKHAGRYYLFYSGGYYASSRYAVGYASADHLLGPYRKAPAPILSSQSSGLSGPGGQDVFTGPDGATWIAFHAAVDEASSARRALYMGRIAWGSDGPAVTMQCAGS